MQKMGLRPADPTGGAHDAPSGQTPLVAAGERTPLSRQHPTQHLRWPDSRASGSQVCPNPPIPHLCLRKLSATTDCEALGQISLCYCLWVRYDLESSKNIKRTRQIPIN